MQNEKIRSEQSLCDFAADGAGQRCARCGFFVPVAPPQKVTKQCRPLASSPPRALAPSPPRALADPTACVHRGEQLRAEPCTGCRGSTIEVSVFACPLHGECTLYDYSARNAKLAGVAVCARCPDRTDEGASGRVGEGANVAQPDSSPHAPREESPPPPGLGRRLKNFGRALLRDLANGRERRAPELVERIFDRQCARCPLFRRTDRDGGVCTHSECGCNVLRTPAELNKLHWASEKCPLGKWPIERLNLIYYILPLTHTGKVWQWHVEQLRQRLHLFNGRRIITIATPGPGNVLSIEPAAKVIEAFGADADSIEFLQRPNDPHHWETPAFREMLSLVYEGSEARGQRPGDAQASSSLTSDLRPLASATFYGHAKGVRRARWDTIKLWCEAMYRHNLDRLDEVRELLAAYSAVGIAKIPQRPTAIAGPGWHFAGTYFWVNDQELFSRPGWDQIQDHSHAVEGYLATQFPEEEAYCLAYLNPPHVYQASTWLNRELEGKEGVGGRGSGVGEEHVAQPPSAVVNVAQPPSAVSPAPPAATLPTISVIVTARNNGPYLRECLASVLAQSYAPLELIYCDDASDDDSVAVARRTFGESLSPLRCHVLALTANVGVEEARNFAAQRAKGQALLFVDGDNQLTRDYLKRMVAALTKETPFVYPDLQHFGDVNRLDRMPEWHEQDITKANCADTCSLMWATAFTTAGGWKAGFQHFGDWHLMLRLSRLGRPARSGAVLLYRDHGASMSNKVKHRLTPDDLAELERRVVADALQ